MNREAPQKFQRTYTDHGVKSVWMYDLSVSKNSPISVEMIYPDATPKAEYVDINTLPQFSKEVQGEMNRLSWAGPCVPIAMSVITGENVIGIARQCVKLGCSFSRRLSLKDTRYFGGWRGTNIQDTQQFSELFEGDWVERHDLNGKTLHQISKEAPSARLYLENSSGSHALAMVEGVVYDWEHKKRRKISRVVELKIKMKS
jgi:hypothetical protein